MPLIRNILSFNDSHLLLWRIEEPEDFFTERLPQNPYYLEQVKKYSHPAKRLEWLATRFLVTLLWNEHTLVTKRGDKIPFSDEHDDFLSISHCRLHAAAIKNPVKPVGVDVEVVLPRIERIKHKFLNDKELEMLKSQDDPIRWMTMMWSAKESLYKKFGDIKLNMKREMSFLRREDQSLFFNVELDNDFEIRVDFEQIGEVILAYC